MVPNGNSTTVLSNAPVFRFLVSLKSCMYALVHCVSFTFKNFLAGIDFPQPNDEIVKWHPLFRLECVADIEPAPLPQPPDTPSCSSARDLLDMANSSMAPRVQQALENVAESTAATALPPEPKPLNPVIEKALKGLPQSLIDKVNTTDPWASSPYNCLFKIKTC